MSDFIPLSVPSFQGNEWLYVKDCIDTEWVSTAGKYVKEFEENICKYVKSKYAVACVNGTSALHIALKIAGVRPGDEVIISTVTFIAPVNVIRYLNADPIFMDCDDYYNIDAFKTIQFIKEQTEYKQGFTVNKTTGKRISALIPVHVFGNAVDLEPLINLCKERNIKIVEDATESLGTYYNEGSLQGRFTGTVGEIGCYSFNGNKIITTGGGGMIVTDDIKYAEQARYLTTQAKDDEIRYIHGEVGYNYRLTNLQAALGVAQLEKLEDYIEIKRQNYEELSKKISKINGLQLGNVPNYSRNNYWMYALLIDKNEYRFDKEALMEHLTNNSVQSRPLWFLNHLQKMYQQSETYKISNAIELYEKTLNIPCSVSLNNKNIMKIEALLKNG